MQPVQPEWHTLLDRIPASLLVVDDRGFILAANERLTGLLGYQSAELKGRKLSEILTLPAHSPECSNLHDAISSTTAVQRALLESGEHLAVEINSEIWDSQRGEIIIKLRDVSERETAQEALRESQRINRTGTWYFDLVTDEVWWSPELFRILDIPVSDTAPPFDTHKNLFTAESWSRLEPAVAAAAEHGTPYNLELELVTKGTGRRFAVARCQPRLDSNGKVDRLLGTFQDVTDLVASRLERDQLLARLSLAQSAAEIGIWDWNMETNELIWDDTMRSMFDDQAEKLDYGNWRNKVHPDDVETAEKELSFSTSTGKLFKTSFRIIRRGEVRHIEAIASKNNQHVVGVNIDVTDQVRMREEARKLNNLESLGVLAGGIAHDFNNQLTSISATSELLALHAQDSDYVIRAAQSLKQSVGRASNLTKQLLTFAKAGSPTKEATSIDALVRENVEFSLRGAALSVSYDFCDDLHNADIDPYQIGQVVQNLTINAVQAVGDAGGSLLITALNVTRGGNEYVELIFEDDGPGIGKEELARIFEPYFTTKPQGHGLGMAICHSIVTQHGGTIEIASQPGQGTRISIVLPATRTAVSESPSAASNLRGIGKVLVVDDMPEVLENTTMMIEALGYETEGADSVEQATALFDAAAANHSAFDAVITDLTMPGGGGGLELLQELRMRSPQVKVIVSSGYAQLDEANAERNGGFTGRLNKPFTLEQLGLELQRVIKG